MAARIKSFEDACKAQGLDPNKVLPDVSMMLEKDQAAITALAKMCIIQRSLNGDWVPDWSDSSQGKYYPWFDVVKSKKGASGFGLSFYVFGFDLTVTGLGARLFYKDRETAEYAGKTFKALYEDMVLMPK